MMPLRQAALAVYVNEELTLDAGWWEEVAESDGRVNRYVHPPARTMFDQLIDYLSQLPQPSDSRIGLAEEGVAATAVCLRWGSYLAVLADRHKPIMKDVRQATLGRIEDAEMARINIEASAALEKWIELMRSDDLRYRTLVRAARYLPMTLHRAQRDRTVPFVALTVPEVTALLSQASVIQSNRQAWAEAYACPTRILANTIINCCWRNGPIEGIHGGKSSTYPLLKRRITSSEERELMRTVASGMAQAVLAVDILIREQSERSWPERVLPFHCVPFVTPTGWSLVEVTREVELPGAEPG